MDVMAIALVILQLVLKFLKTLNVLIKKMTFSVDHFGMIKSILKKQKDSTLPIVNRLKNGKRWMAINTVIFRFVMLHGT